MNFNNNSGFKLNIKKLYLFSFFVSLHFLGAVLVPFFTDWGQISFAQTMLLQSWFMLWVFLLEIPTGTIADFLGRKKSLALGCIANILGVTVYAIVPNFFLFLIGEFFWAVATAFFSGADTALAYDSLKKIGKTKESKKILGRINISKLTGYMIGAPIGSIIAITFGLNMPLLLMGIPLTIAFLIALTFKEPQEKRVKPKYFEILKQGTKFFYKHKILRILAIDLIAINTIGYFVIWLSQPMLKQAGVGIAFFGIMQAIFLASEILFIHANQKFEKVLGSKRTIISISFIIAGLVLLASGLIPIISIVIIAILIGGGISLSKLPLFESYLNKYISSQKRATTLSTIFMLEKLVLVILNPILGILADWSLNNTLVIIGAIAIIFPIISKIEEKHLID